MRNLRTSAATFNAAKKLGVVALTLSLLMWLSAFLSVGNEWFLMWQSKEWSGESGRRSHVRDRGHYLALPRHARCGRPGVVKKTSPREVR